MLEILVLMALGMLVGYILRGKQKAISGIEKAILWSIFLLLFFLGLSIGGNEVIMASLPSLGLNALIITLGGVAGSIIAAWALWKLVFKKVRREE
ncbi:MAG: LysO family transporter [Bacteroidales bacterium]|jgi:uncharacterized membrane protein YbjE (DUF340 family)|nr:LysO family transporter [Bacteroidales bacterium]NLM92869.1 LysO family transporter [Bacteroidales bacterium]